jgi:CRP-like cAMP-binding protein
MIGPPFIGPPGADSLFRSNSEAEQAFIDGLKGPPLHLGQRAHVISPSQGEYGLYSLAEGWAYRYRTLETGVRQIVDFVLPGELIGLSAYADVKVAYGVCALTDVVLHPLDPARFRAVYRDFPDLTEALVRTLLLDKQRADRRLLLLGRQRPSQRLCHLMLELRDRLAARGLATEGACDFPLTYEQMTDALGISRSQLARSLAEIRERGWAVLTESRLTFLSPDEMGRFCEYDPGPAFEQRVLI